MTQSPPKHPESDHPESDHPESNQTDDASPSDSQADQKQSSKNKFKSIVKPRVLIPIGLVLIGAGAAAWYFLSQTESEIIELSGRLEGYPTDIDSEVTGKIDLITVREGDRVEQGDQIAQLNESELQARLDGATARLRAAQQRATQAQRRLSVIQSQINQAQLTQEQAVGESQGRILEAEANLAAAEAQLIQSQAELTEAQSRLELERVDLRRARFLVEQGALADEALDQAQTAYDTAIATVSNREAAIAAARRQVNATEGTLEQARSTGFNPEIRTARVQELQSQLEVNQAELEAARADVENAQAVRREILAQIDDLDIESPIGGVVLTRTVEPGTVVTNGTTLLTVLDPDSVYMRGFIPEGQIGRVRVGQPARVYLDSFPDRPLDAYVMAIDTEASFTPENIYFKEDRVQQVFGVDIKIVNPDGFAKPGMPADAEIIPQELPDSTDIIED
ncbi:MAG: HlyD family secretion protein [Elainellaceae cyanobacterium]